MFFASFMYQQSSPKSFGNSASLPLTQRLDRLCHVALSLALVVQQCVKYFGFCRECYFFHIIGLMVHYISCIHNYFVNQCSLNRDNVEADILGANLYRRYLSGVSVPEPRRFPSDILLPQTVVHVESILVSTGVHSSNVISVKSQDQEYVANNSQSSCQSHCHRDFADVTPELFTPTVLVTNVKSAVQYILQRQKYDAT